MAKLAYILKKIQSLGLRNSFLKAIGYDSAYDCCYRKKGSDVFYHLPEKKGFWYADPITFVFEGHTYVFMEVFEEDVHLGRIGYSELTDGGWGDVNIIISEPFHMSFPMLFRFGEDIYMLPETSTANKQILYKCINFPDKWDKIETFFDGKRLVDSVLINVNGNVFTFLASECNQENDLEAKFCRYNVTLGDVIKAQLDQEYSEKQVFSRLARNAGGVTTEGLLPLQESTDVVYGHSTVFVPIDEVIYNTELGNIIHSENYSRIMPEDVITDNGFRHKIIGTHTYSETEEYEVIDVQFYRFSKYKWKERLSRRR